MELCQICGMSYEIVYRVPDKVWAKIRPKRYSGGLLCLRCADFEARKKGITLYWEASIGEFPNRKIEDTIHLTQTEINGLLEYSCSVPTGVIVGKRWKRRIIGGWLMGEYTEGRPGYINTVWKRIIKINQI